MDKSKLIEIATFPFVNNSSVLQSMLEDEGIPFFIRNENFTSLYPGALIDGGAGLVVREEDVERAIEVVKEGGFTDFLKDKYRE